MSFPAALLAASLVVASPPSVDLERPGRWQQARPGEQYKACPRPSWPAPDAQAPAPGLGRRVVILGDSLTRYAYRPLHKRLVRDGWLPTIVCWGGMQTDWGLANAKDVAKRRYLPDRIVIAFGTNDIHRNPCTDDCARHVRTYGQRVRKMLTYLGPQRQVWWFNIDMDADRATRALGEPWNRNFPAFNRALRRTAADYPNTEVVNWRKLVRRNPATIRYSADGLHYAPLRPARKSAGTMLRVRTIARLLKSSG